MDNRLTIKKNDNKIIEIDLDDKFVVLQAIGKRYEIKYQFPVCYRDKLLKIENNASGTGFYYDKLTMYVNKSSFDNSIGNTVIYNCTKDFDLEVVWKNEVINIQELLDIRTMVGMDNSITIERQGFRMYCMRQGSFRISLYNSNMLQ